MVEETFASQCPRGDDGCTACAGINALQLAKREAEEKLNSIIRELRRKKTSVNYAHSPIFERFPTEVMSSIFLACTEVENMDYRVGQLKEYQDLSVSLKLAQVCQLWREIALSTPHLWTHIHISLDNHRHQRKNMSALQDILSRSKKFPLEITLTSRTAMQLEIWSCFDFHLYKPILSTLLSHSERWRSLGLFLPSVLINFLFESIGDAVEFQSLHVHCNDILENQWSLPHWTNKALIRSKFLTLTNFSPVGFKVRWDIVTHVVANKFQTDKALQLLMTAPSLQSFTLIDLDEDATFDESDFPTHIVHENLRYLSYEAKLSVFQETINMFNYCSFPGLQKLCYNTGRGTEDQNLLECMEQMQSSSLTHLEINEAYFEAIYLIMLLQELPWITHLQLTPEPYIEAHDECDISDIFKVLAKTMILPNLQSFNYLSGWVFPWHLLPKLFGKPSDAHRRPLRHFKLINSTVFSGDPIIPKDALIQLIELCREGCDIQYEDSNTPKTDLFQASLEFHDLSL